MWEKANAVSSRRMLRNGRCIYLLKPCVFSLLKKPAELITMQVFLNLWGCLLGLAYLSLGYHLVFCLKASPWKQAAINKSLGRLVPVKKDPKPLPIPMYHTTKPSKPSRECPRRPQRKKTSARNQKRGATKVGEIYWPKRVLATFFGNSSAVEIWYTLKNHVFMPPFGIAHNVRSWEACFWCINCINWIWTALGLWLHEDFQTDPLSKPMAWAGKNRRPGLTRVFRMIFFGNDTLCTGIV